MIEEFFSAIKSVFGQKKTFLCQHIIYRSGQNLESCINLTAFW